MLRSLQKQLVRDLQASWVKSALLGVLLLVGLAFWIPPLVRSLGKKAPPQLAAASPIAATAQGPVPSSSSGDAAGEITWKTVERVLDDPLVRSASIEGVRSNPFRVDRDQFPPPILFAEDAESQQRTPRGAEPLIPTGLALKSTIVGSSRRAAYINRKLYFEGAEVRSEDGQTYVLRAVHPRRVLLEQDGQTFELKIADRAAAEGGLSRDFRDDAN